METKKLDIDIEFNGWFIKPNIAFHEIIDRLKQEGIIK